MTEMNVQWADGVKRSSEEEIIFEEALWRRVGNRICRRWRRDFLVLRRIDAHLELYSQKNDNFSKVFISAKVQPLANWQEQGKMKNRFVFLAQFQGEMDEEDDFDMRDCVLMTKSGSKFSNRNLVGRWYKFRAANLSIMVKWMRALQPDNLLEGVGPDPSTSLRVLTTVESWVGHWDEIHPSMLDVQWQHSHKLTKRSKSSGSGTTAPSVSNTTVSGPLPPSSASGSARITVNVMPPSYEEVMCQLGGDQIDAPGDSLKRFREHTPPCESVSLSGGNVSTWTRRAEDDTFLPPYGPARLLPINMGQGVELGLPNHVQQLWDPNQEHIIYVDHMARRVLLEPPQTIASTGDSSTQPHTTSDSSSRKNSLTSSGLSATPSSSVIPHSDRWLPTFTPSSLSTNNNASVFCPLPCSDLGRDPLDRLQIFKNVDLGEDNFICIPDEDRWDSSMAEYQAKMAEATPIGLLLDGNGRDGCDGECGLNGRNGQPGLNGRAGSSHGSRGEDGRSGGNGDNGMCGGIGGDGQNGHKVSVYLCPSETNDHVLISGALQSSLPVMSPRVLLVECRGGEGGAGGDGGKGGYGGKGGDGGPGAHGLDGDGGDGGNGGNGGTGGNGGDGGDGGNGGHGGAVIVTATDPVMFMLVQVDVRGGAGGQAGIPGDEGKGGEYGTPGEPGKGGMSRNNVGGHHGADSMGNNCRSAACGGVGGNDCDSLAHKGVGGATVSLGSDGCYGESGKAGLSGKRGYKGDSGLDGEPGVVYWNIVNPETGKVVWSSNKCRYEAQVEKYRIEAVNDDGIFEANETVRIVDISIRNTGGMTLPAGAILDFPSTSTVRMLPGQICILPELSPGDMIVLDRTFQGRIHDISTPNKPGPFLGKAEFMSRITLMNRSFFGGKMVHSVEVQYPLRLGALNIPNQMGRGEETNMKINIENLSYVPYGDAVNTPVELRVRLDRRLLVTGSIRCPSSNSSTPRPHSQNSHSPPPGLQLVFFPDQKDSVYSVVDSVPPRSSFQLGMSLYLENKAELFDRVLVQVELYLRGKLIEYGQQRIRVAPYFRGAGKPGQVLFITGPETTRTTFILWQHLLQNLGLTDVDFWDTERYQGLSFHNNSKERHEVSWSGRYRGKMIIFPYYKSHLLCGKDIAEHFEPTRTKICSGAVHDSSFLAICEGEDLLDEAAQMLLSIASEPVTDSFLPKYGGTHMFSPNGACHKREVADRRVQQIVKSANRHQPHRASVILYRSINYNPITCLSWSYGHLELKRLSVERTSRLCIMTIPEINCQPGQVTIPVANHCVQVMLMIMALMSTSCRSHLLNLNPARPEFLLPWGERLSIARLAVLSLQAYLTGEVSKNMKGCWRFQYLCEDIVTNAARYRIDLSTTLLYMGQYKRLAQKRAPKKWRNKINELYENALQALYKCLGSRYVGKCLKEAQNYNYNPRFMHFSHLVDASLSVMPNRVTADDALSDLSTFLQPPEYEMVHATQNHLPLASAPPVHL